MIRTLLVANRGEIARRVFRTARSMGMRCAAIFADADADAPFAAEADVAVRLPGGYLDIDAVIAAALAADADAVHPGYGFLAENAAFARAVADAGMVWVGPDASAIEQMGDKLAAKAAARAAGLPILPSADDPADAASVGYPLLVKAAAGGGGKGMRLVTEPEDLHEAVAAARREALGAFGDDTVFLERYLKRCRHVEIQVLGDSHGSVVHLGERECSIQRRHQKIIEEAPSAALDASQRAAMGDAAVRLAQSIGYHSAGTVEMLLDEDTGDFYFLEVNTRLQVEHPVTEAITGIDLVREQLRIAAGAPLGYSQTDITFSGHAVEARLYAEDPAAGFLPAVGTVAVFEPAAAPEVRWDSGVETNSVVGLEFDPMLAKVTAHAATRSEAAARLALALERLHIGGVTTNRHFLVSALRSEAFNTADTTTDFVERVDLETAPRLDDRVLCETAVAAAMWLQFEERRQARTLGWMPAGWRHGRLPAERLDLLIASHTEGSRATVAFSPRRDGSFKVAVSRGDDISAEGVATVESWSAEHLSIEWNARRVGYRVKRADDKLFLTGTAETVTVTVVPRFSAGSDAEVQGGFTAPMPGVIVDIRVQAGEHVRAGSTLVVMEGMKMEHHLNAPSDGVVTEVLVKPGDQVDNGAPLLVFEATDHSGNSATDPASVSISSGQGASERGAHG